jgi:hypothetical protein
MSRPSARVLLFAERDAEVALGFDVVPHERVQTPGTLARWPPLTGSPVALRFVLRSEDRHEVILIGEIVRVRDALGWVRDHAAESQATVIHAAGPGVGASAGGDRALARRCERDRRLQGSDENTARGVLAAVLVDEAAEVGVDVVGALLHLIGDRERQHGGWRGLQLRGVPVFPLPSRALPKGIVAADWVTSGCPARPGSRRSP